LTLRERFYSKALNIGDCLIWIASKSCSDKKAKEGKCQYGQFWYRRKLVLAHRFSYQLNVGKIKKGMTLDHLCKKTLCVKHEHLEPVSLAENIMRGNGATAKNARKTHCINGHFLSGDNLETYGIKKGHRKCKKCRQYRELLEA